MKNLDYKAVTRKYSELYKYNLDDVRAAFDDIEEQVYDKIYPNYISAFCFDSIRLFDIMHDQGEQRLSNIALHEHATDHHCPFRELKFHPEGWTDVKLTIEQF